MTDMAAMKKENAKLREENDRLKQELKDCDKGFDEWDLTAEDIKKDFQIFQSMLIKSREENTALIKENERLISNNVSLMQENLFFKEKSLQRKRRRIEKSKNKV